MHGTTVGSAPMMYKKPKSTILYNEKFPIKSLKPLPGQF